MIYSGRCSSPLIIPGRCPSLQLLLSLGLTSRHLRNPWDSQSIRFIFGIDAMANLKDLAEHLDDLEYSELERPPRYTIRTVPRQARERRKERVVAGRQFDTLKLV